MIHYTECPVCGSSGIRKTITAKDYTVSQETFEIWQCASCAARFTQHVPETEAIGKYYKSDNYISHTESASGIINRLYLTVRNFTFRTKRKLIEQFSGKTTGRLLDVGAGTGAFLAYMRKNGWRVSGLEPDSGAIERACKQYHIDLHPADTLYRLPEKQFDIITLWHVLEHVHDLHGYLTRLRALLDEHGLLFIAVPNYTSDDAERYGAVWAAYDVPRHLYHFSPASMQFLAKKHRFSIVATEAMWMDSFYVSMLSEQYLKRSPALVRGIVSGLKSNGKALSNRRRASSLIYVLRAVD